jgi:hypothetical protein
MYLALSSVMWRSRESPAHTVRRQQRGLVQAAVVEQDLINPIGLAGLGGCDSRPMLRLDSREVHRYNAEYGAGGG